MITLRALVHGCWKQHSQVKARDAEGELILLCTTCGESERVLTHPTLKGPAHEQAEVRGKPLTKVIRARPSKVVGGRFQ